MGCYVLSEGSSLIAAGNREGLPEDKYSGFRAVQGLKQ